LVHPLTQCLLHGPAPDHGETQLRPTHDGVEQDVHALVPLQATDIADVNFVPSPNAPALRLDFSITPDVDTQRNQVRLARVALALHDRPGVRVAHDDGTRMPQCPTLQPAERD